MWSNQTDYFFKFVILFTNPFFLLGLLMLIIECWLVIIVIFVNEIIVLIHLKQIMEVSLKFKFYKDIVKLKALKEYMEIHIILKIKKQLKHLIELFRTFSYLQKTTNKSSITWKIVYTTSFYFTMEESTKHLK